MLFRSIGFDFAKSGDYSMRAGGGGQGTYEFNGGKTFKARSEERRVGKECRSRWST